MISHFHSPPLTVLVVIIMTLFIPFQICHFCSFIFGLSLIQSIYLSLFFAFLSQLATIDSPLIRFPRNPFFYCSDILNPERNSFSLPIATKNCRRLNWISFLFPFQPVTHTLAKSACISAVSICIHVLRFSTVTL